MTIDLRPARLEAESAIRQLIARFCFAIDDCDLPGSEALPSWNSYAEAYPNG